MADSYRGSPLELALGLLDPVLLLIAAQDPNGLALLTPPAASAGEILVRVQQRHYRGSTGEVRLPCPLFLFYFLLKQCVHNC
jgi:hypothetical protein